MSTESERLAAAQSLALVELRAEIRDLRNDITRRASLADKTLAIAGKLQLTQAVGIAIVIVSMAMAAPLFIGGMLLATQDPAAVLAFVADLFHLTRGGV